MVVEKRLSCEHTVGDPQKVSVTGLAHRTVEKSYGWNDLNFSKGFACTQVIDDDEKDKMTTQ